jgi:hypothetical protein
MKTYFAALLLTLLFVSCKKDKDNDCDINITTVSGTYYLESIWYRLPSGFEEEVTANFMEACEVGDTYTLSENGVLVYTDTGGACDPNGTETTTWTLSGNAISIPAGVLAATGNIESFDCSTLIIVGPNTAQPGDRTTFTFKKM